MEFVATGVLGWRMGLDNSDNDKFKIGTQTDIGTTPYITVDASGGKVGIGTTSPKSLLTVDGSFAVGTNGTEFIVDTDGNTTTTASFTMTDLATPAGAFLAVDTNGLVIATTSPAAGSGITHLNDETLGSIGDVSTTTLAYGYHLVWDTSNWISTSTWPFFETEFDSLFNATTTWAGFDNLFDTRLNASTTRPTDDDITASIATHMAVTADTDTTGHLTDTDWDTFNNKWDGLTDMVLTDNYIYVGDASNDPVGVAMSNDCSIASNGAITCDHDALDNFVANEHLDWTGDLGAVNIHAGNYTDTTYLGGTNLTLVDTTFNVDDSFVKLVGDTGMTGVFDFGGATSFEIPNAAAPVIDTAGEIGLDTTDNQLLVADSGNTARVIPIEQALFSFVLASTSPDFVSGGIIHIPKWTKDGRDITQFRCHVDGGTSVVVNVSDNGTNDTESITCATTQTSDTDVATNSVFTADELWRVEIGTITGSVDYLIFEAYGWITRE
jgi:hypothetical protein